MYIFLLIYLSIDSVRFGNNGLSLDLFVVKDYLYLLFHVAQLVQFTGVNTWYGMSCIQSRPVFLISFHWLVCVSTSHNQMNLFCLYTFLMHQYILEVSFHLVHHLLRTDLAFYRLVLKQCFFRPTSGHLFCDLFSDLIKMS